MERHHLVTGFLFLLSVFVAGCAEPSGRQPEVLQYGRMHDVLSGGAGKAVQLVSLADALKEPHACAVGALAGLEGEITIVDGSAWVARPAGAGLRIDGPSSTSKDGAALLLLSHVAEWDRFTIEKDLAGEALDAFIADKARGAGLDMAQPFAFVIEGSVTDLQLHVLNGMCPMKPGVALAEGEKPWQHRMGNPQNATVVGFYAADSVGNMTHPGTSIHAHAILDVNGQAVTGHIERIAVAAGAVLRIPRAR